jgi:hypothetical protein
MKASSNIAWFFGFDKNIINESLLVYVDRFLKPYAALLVLISRVFCTKIFIVTTLIAILA